MWRAIVAAVWLAGAGGALAEEADPQLDAALLQCPGAAPFVEADRLREQALARRSAGIEPSEPRLRGQLLEMARLDQQARDGDWSQAMVEKMLAVDAANLAKIRQVVADHGGLPDVRAVGVDGLRAAWLLVQHADADAGLQRQVLDGLAPRLASGEVSSREFALLTDWVLVNAGKPQRYGSQLAAIGGRWQPKAMEAPEQVDQRRASIGQMPLADYLCVAAQMFPAPATDAEGRLL